MIVPPCLSRGRPRESEDPYAVPSRSAAAYGSRLCGRRSASKTRVSALMAALAGTTRICGLPSINAHLFLRIRAHVARGQLHGRDDLRIGRAAAEIAGEIMPDLVLVGFRMLRDQLARHQDKAGRAEAALERPAFDERALDGIE